MSDAGIDTFSTGPASNTQTFLQLSNILPSVDGLLRTRWGVSAWPSSGPVGTGMSSVVRTFFYNVPQDASNPTNTATENLWIATDNQNFSTVTDNNLGTFSGHGPTNFASAGTVGAVTSRNWFYYGNGVNAPRKVYPGYTTANTDSLLGIAYPGAGSGSTTLANYPCALLASYSAYNFLGTSGTVYNASTGYGYTSAPTVTITDPTGAGSGASITLQIGVHGEVTGWTLVSGGTAYKQAVASVAAPPSGGVQANLVLYVQTNSSAPNAGQVVGCDFAGPMSFVAGRKYTVALQNSISGHTSDVYTTDLPSTSQTGTFLDSLTSQYSGSTLSSATDVPVYISSPNVTAGFTQVELVISVPQASLDPQVDTVILLGTSDGGSVGTLYEVAQIPLSSFTLVSGYYQYYYVDTLPDSLNDANTSTTSFSSTGSVIANQYTTNLTFGGQFQYNSSGGGQIRTIGLTDGVETGYLTAYGFGLSVPSSATITGVEVQIYWQGQASGTGELTTMSLFNSGSPIGTVKTPNIFNTSTALTTTQGSTSDLWGATLTPAVVNSSTFGFGLKITPQTVSGTDRSFFYTWTVTVYYEGASGLGDTLLESDLYAFTDSDGTIYGILNNTPPTAEGFLYPVIHQGRMFATDGKTVFYSKSLDEVTTPTGLITSKWEECWPGDYQLPVALNNETIVGLKSDGTNLHIGSNKGIFTCYGSGPEDFSIPSQAFAQTGILSNDCWSVVYAEGMPAGFVWITQDLKVMHSDFSTYREIGTPVFKTLQTLDQTAINTAKIGSLTYGPWNFAILSFHDVSGNIQFLIWETRLQKWYQWTLFSGSAPSMTVSSAFVYQYPTSNSTFNAGDVRLFFWAAQSSNYLSLYFDPHNTSGDYSYGVGTVAVPWIVQTSWQDLEDSTAIKVINEIEMTTDVALNSLFVTLYGATSQSQFDSGGTSLKTGNPVNGPMSALNTAKFYCAGAATSAKYYSIKFNGSLTPNSIALSSFAIESYPMSRI